MARAFDCWICGKTFPSVAACNRHRHEAHSVKINENLTIEYIMPWSAFTRRRKENHALR
jgi:hypothetical protein